jgi:hypothetical protein
VAIALHLVAASLHGALGRRASGLAVAVLVGALFRVAGGGACGQRGHRYNDGEESELHRGAYNALLPLPLQEGKPDVLGFFGLVLRIRETFWTFSPARLNICRMRVSLRVLLCSLLLAGGVVAIGQTASAETPSSAISSEFKKMMTALEQHDFNAFIADGTTEVKEKLTQQMFDGVSQSIGSSLKAGYDSVYLTQLKQQGCQVYVWKVSVKDGGDEFLAKLAMQDGKVAGFRLQ